MDNPVSFSAVVLAAGASTRLPGSVSKPFRLIHGRPVFSFSLSVLAACPGVQEIALVVPPEILDGFRAQWDAVLALPCPVHVVAGGQRRQDSVKNGVNALFSGTSGPEPELLAIHDAARPGISRDMVLRLLDAARHYGAAIPGIPVSDTLKRVNADGEILETVDRKGVVAVATPQVFSSSAYRKLLAAKVEEEIVVTDDAQWFEQAGHLVRVISGEFSALKLTNASDLSQLESLLKSC